MKFLYTQTILLVISVGFLLYLLSLNYFVPIKDEKIDWYNVSMVLLLISIFVQALISLLVYIFSNLKKIREKIFPKYNIALRWGIGISICLLISLFSGIYGIIPVGYTFLILLIIFILLNLLFF